MDLLTVGTYARPADDDALRALQPSLGPDRAVLGGGSWLFSAPQHHLAGLVDLTALDWAPVAADADGLTLAATATLATLADLDPSSFPQWPAVALFAGCCEALVGSRKIWHTATVGGNVCLALPAAPMVALAAVLDGRATVWTPDGGVRTAPVVDLVVGAQRTSLAPGEVLRSIRLPASALRARTALRRASLSPLGRSAALLAGRRDPDGGFVLAVTASLPRPAVLRYPDLPTAEVLAADVDALGAELRWYDDPHGAPAWRRAMTLRDAEAIRRELGDGA
ncbi:FAD binding domain-containing protein [Actinomycetospora corticicola]|uniref:CO/xanthine dehydrogenase FAD-binding subunit n=1 Tax=Actinomycetospora corticicola TaxID=663602 RepID=A0A7Y9DXY8_9PSEU|nr:FAD binding domain-containing protein [Actinomycetospora corticicola]NYD37608.1 CO/xanthine dehydrogenase FAD-binding subunit [Actinomycetospora corticicola]